MDEEKDEAPEATVLALWETFGHCFGIGSGVSLSDEFKLVRKLHSLNVLGTQNSWLGLTPYGFLAKC